MSGTITYLGAGSLFSTGNLAAPVTLQDDDFAVVFSSSQTPNTGGSTATAVGNVNGLTATVMQTISSFARLIGVPLASGDTGITVGGGTSYTQAFFFRKVDAAASVAASSAKANGSGASTTGLDLTATVGDTMVVQMVAQYDDGTVAASGTGWTQGPTYSTTSGPDGKHSGAYKEIQKGATAGADLTWTLGDSLSWFTAAMLLIPKPAPKEIAVATSDSLTVTVDASAFVSALFIAAATDDDLTVTVDATTRRRSYRKPRRETVWIHDLAGNRVGALR